MKNAMTALDALPDARPQTDPATAEARPPLDAPRSLRPRRVAHELKRRELTVRRVEALSPGVRRITLGGDDLADFTSLGFDDHVKLFFDTGAAAGAARRDYTPRSFDRAARELVIEFALHGDGPAAGWAAQARPGQTLLVGGPKGSFILPEGLDWHWLVADLTALPALARRLEELPSGALVKALVIAPDPADRRPLASAAHVDLHWVPDAGTALARVRTWARPVGEGFAWAAGEASAMAALRRVLVDEIGLSGEQVRASAYWKQGVADHHESLGPRGG